MATTSFSSFFFHLYFSSSSPSFSSAIYQAESCYAVETLVLTIRLFVFICFICLHSLSINIGDKPRVVTTVTVQLSGDRRVVDEALAAQFLQVFRNYLSNPKSMLL